jgi:GT2 family glycosyltransferase
LFREFLNLVPELKSPLARVASGIKSFISYTITLKKRTQITKFRAVEAVSGAAVLFRKAVWTAIGQFDPDFFLYHEEIDFCTRVRKAGFEVSLTPVPIIHFDGQASGYRTGRLPQMPVLEWRILGMNRLWAKHRPGLAHSLWRWMAIALFTMRLGLLKFGAFSGLKDGKYVANRVSDLRKLCGKIAQSVS